MPPKGRDNILRTDCSDHMLRWPSHIWAHSSGSVYTTVSSASVKGCWCNWHPQWNNTKRPQQQAWINFTLILLCFTEIQIACSSSHSCQGTQQMFANTLSFSDDPWMSNNIPRRLKKRAMQFWKLWQFEKKKKTVTASFIQTIMTVKSVFFPLGWQHCFVKFHNNLQDDLNILLPIVSCWVRNHKLLIMAFLYTANLVY